MSFSLYDAVVPSHLQILRALDRVLKAAEGFCEERDMAQAELIDARLAPDMLPLGYQVKSCAVHSIGGIEGTRAGSFSPDTASWSLIHALLTEPESDRASHINGS